MQRRAISESLRTAAAVFAHVPLRGRRLATGTNWAFLAGACLCLSACGTPPGSFDVEQSAQNKWSNLVALVQFKKLPGQPLPADRVVCPDISILNDSAADRVYASNDNPTNANLRYQFSLNDVARDCKAAGNQMTLRVGAAGRVLLGPVGSPGTFDAPVNVAVVQRSDDSPVFTKVYHVPVTVAANTTEAPFTLVTEPLNVPYAGPHSRHDYIIKVGFDTSAIHTKDSGNSGRHRSRHRRSSSSTD